MSIKTILLPIISSFCSATTFEQCSKSDRGSFLVNDTSINPVFKLDELVPKFIPESLKMASADSIFLSDSILYFVEFKGGDGRGYSCSHDFLSGRNVIAKCYESIHFVENIICKKSNPPILLDEIKICFLLVIDIQNDCVGAVINAFEDNFSIDYSMRSDGLDKFRSRTISGDRIYYDAVKIVTNEWFNINARNYFI